MHILQGQLANNRARNGDHYWVLAHVTPSWDTSGNITSYHSNRRVPDRKIVTESIIPLYAQLLAEEKKHSNSKEGMAASTGMVVDLLTQNNLEYDQFIAANM
ncbi:MAG: PAS sensor protein [Rhodospirillaceae bacterium]|nr:PAS sensor protein [Rhodospirillaceae bacterium]